LLNSQFHHTLYFPDNNVSQGTLRHIYWSNHSLMPV